MYFPDEIWQAPVQHTMPFQKSWCLFGMTQLSNLRLVILPVVKRVFKSAKRLSLLKTQAFVVKNLTITCADQAW